MSVMFRGAKRFWGELSSWDVSNVLDMSDMFNGADSFIADISGWNVSKVVNMNEMFSQADSFNQDLSSWNVENVESCEGFDDGCEGDDFVLPNFTKCSI